MDILISANQMILELVRSVPQDLRDDLCDEKFALWFEQINKVGTDGEKL